MDAVDELDDLLRAHRRKHYIFHEKREGVLWVFTHKAPCACRIDEDHWVERID